MPRQLLIDRMPAHNPNDGGQRDFARDWRHRYVALEGGWGSGKTWIGARKLLALHLHNAFDATDSATFVASALIAPSYGNAADFAVPALRDAIEATGLSSDYRASGTICGSIAAPALVFPDLGTVDHPSAILIRSADAPEKITGWEVGAYWCDEAARFPEDWTDPKRDPLIQIKGRLRHPKAVLRQGLYTYTNEGDHTRVYRAFHSGSDNHALYRAASRENPAIAEWAKEMESTLTPELREQYLEGRAISLAGERVYRYFEESRNVDVSLALNFSAPIHVALDFNIAPGMHVEIGQHDEARDLLTVTHEIHERGLDVRGAMDRLERLIRAELRGAKVPEIHLFGDATGGSRWAGTGQSCYDIVRTHLDGIGWRFRYRVPASNPFVVDRSNAFNLALCAPDGTVHWKCHPRCARLIEDLRTLKFDARGEVDKRQRNLSHPSDAEGYRVHYLRPVRVLQSGTASGGRWSIG